MFTDPDGLTPGTAVGAGIGTLVFPGPGTAVGALIGTGIQALAGGATLAAILSTPGDSSSSTSEKKRGVEAWNKAPPINAGQYSCRYVMYFPEDLCKGGKCPPFVTGRGYGLTLHGAMAQARTEAQEKIPQGCGHQHHGQMWCRYGGGPVFMP